MNTDKTLKYQLYVQREEFFYHESYDHEQFLYDAICQGNVELIEENQRKYSKYATEGKGNLSDNPVRNQIYHLVANTAVITRVCVNNGLPHETAYTLSDIYIRKADACTTTAAVMKLNDEMVLHFTRLMRELHYEAPVSLTIQKTCNYILDNLHQKLTTKILADYVGVNRTYLSTLFKREIGKTIQEYIMKKRLETAASMLVSTDFPYSSIATTLCFSSQSYFGKCFKEYYGCTPKEYRTGTKGFAKPNTDGRIAKQ